MLQELNQYPEAIAAYNKAISIDDRDAKFWFAKGYILYKAKQYNQEIAAYDRDRVWIYRSDAFYDLEKYPQAIANYDRAIAIDEKNTFAWFNLEQIKQIR